ncbi:hypothetical protein BpHYR1_048720 [Brachionus plicatilis]|uniref:MULE transposase domain-containing protein n=1 Tax=Brachionus plicatilis TaxID=10195 RepID=A0A3M7R8R0_BRAPC|nr:hypothetical protein BpHYR1_048720 [Brachionus plicatilis]
MAEGSAQYEDDTVSSQCSSTKSLEWNILLQANDEEEMDETILTKIPYNSIRSSHTKTNCNLKAIAKIDKHKMHQEIRRCKGHVIMEGLEKVEMKCPVQFKVFRCDNCSTYKLFQNNEHSSGCEDIITDVDMCNGENADNADLNGQFYPIAFALISHERSGDFDLFFGALKNVFNSMGILFSPTYMMMDANDASYIAVEKHFPNCIFLMCFFHVKFNVKKNSKFYPIANQEVGDDEFDINGKIKSDSDSDEKDEITSSEDELNSVRDENSELNSITDNRHLRCFAHSVQVVVKKSLKKNLSLAVPSIFQLLQHLNNFNPVNESLKSFITELKEQLSDRFKNIFSALIPSKSNELHDFAWYIASFLDPQLKLKWLEITELEDVEKSLFTEIFKEYLFKEWSVIRQKQTNESQLSQILASERNDSVESSLFNKRNL